MLMAQPMQLFKIIMGWSGGAMVLGKISSAGASYNLDDSRAYCSCSRCGWGSLDIFTLLYLFSRLSPCLWGWPDID